MTLLQWLCSALAPRPARKRQPTRRLGVEPLEDRTTPSTLTVLNTNDGGAGSLRQALLDAAPGDTVAFQAGVTGTIHLGSTLSIDKSLTLTGPGRDLLTVSGGNYASGGSSVTDFLVPAGVNATISGLTVADGYGYAGGIGNLGTLTVANCTFSSNAAEIGGGIYSPSGTTLTVDGCTFVDNSADDGSTTRSGGGISSGGTLLVRNSTFSRNWSSYGADGIYCYSGTAVVTNCTFSDNWASYAIRNGFSCTLSVSNCTFSRNVIAINNRNTATLTNCTITGGVENGGSLTMSNSILDSLFLGNRTVSSLGHNLIGITDGTTGWVASDLIGTEASPLDPRLAPLGNYGGPTATMPPLAGSPALGAGSVALALDAHGNPLTSDQRGLPRVVDGRIDIGAYQTQPNATSLPAAVPGAPAVTLQAPTGTTLSDVAAVSPNQGTGLPSDAVLPVGGFDFTVGGVAAGATAEVVLLIPTGTEVNAYYKYNPATQTWSPFTGATFEDRNGDGTKDVVLHLTDGGLGDQDGVLNGVIVDPGAPVYVPPLQVRIDIKPGDGTNTVNLDSQGVIAVAVLSSATFDARLVDVASVRFAGAAAVGWSLKDVNGDGRLDLVLNFRTQDTTLRALYAQLLADDVDADGVLDSSHQAASITLTGSTTTQQQFQGSDTIDLFLAGKALRDLLGRLAAVGAI